MDIFVGVLVVFVVVFPFFFFGGWFCWNIDIVKSFIAVAWGRQYCSFGGKSVFPCFLPWYLNLGYLVYICTHT